jgi:inosose dehydratase
MPKLNPSTPHFAVGSAIFQKVTPEDVAFVAAQGFPAMEMYRNSFTPEFLARPQGFKELLDQHGLRMITCSNGGPGMSTDFIDPAKKAQTMADHIAFARDVLKLFGCTHFKMNMGRRNPKGTSVAELQAIAGTLNELGRATLDMGIKLSPHPHIWGPIEREHEIRFLMELTDPRYVFLCPDTAHINLGGGDPVAIVTDFYDRISAVHWKDSKASYRGYTGATPTQEMHAQEILYKDLGNNGVDHEYIYKFLLSKGYTGWITLDLDPPRPAEGEGTKYDKLLINKRYLTDTLKVAQL